MRLPLKFAGGLLLFIILIFAGCSVFLRGCLSAYDERYATAPVFLFEKDTSRIVLALVTFEKATSYSSGGGVTHKSVSTSYYLQTNHAVSGKKLLEQKIADHSDIEQYPVKMLASNGTHAWLFVNELQAYDPFTLEKRADISILEKNNPALKGKFPKESQYYTYNRYSNSFFITATDGRIWQLNTHTLLATEVESKEDTDPFAARIKAVEQQQKQIDAAADSLYRQNLPSQNYYTLRTKLYAQRDSLRQIQGLLAKQNDAAKAVKRKIDDLTDGSLSYNSLLSNEDTSGGRWFGLLTGNELEKLYNHFEHRPQYGETSRRKLWVTSYQQKPDGDIVFDKENAAALTATQAFLSAGFLIDKATGIPFINNGWLILHKSQVGNTGTIQISAIGKQGNVLWTADTQLQEWEDYVCTPAYLYVVGSNEKELGSDQANLLWIIDLANGQMTGYNYFTNSN